MSVLLLRSYLGYAAGQVVELPASTEATLIAQNLAQTALTSATTTGAITANVQQGMAAIAAAGTSVVVTNSLVDASTKIHAVIAQATADTTATFVARIVPAAGSFTIFVNAAATATVLLDWSIIPVVNTSGS
jgi:hypothetical protein